MSDSCSSRHFSWLMKSCFPNPQNHTNPSPISAINAPPSPNHHVHHNISTISSLPDDLLLECLSRVSQSSLSTIPLVCRRWSSLIDSSAFYNLRRLHGRLHYTVFSVFVSFSGLWTASNCFAGDSFWKTTSLPIDDAVSSGCFLSLFSHARIAAIGRRIYIIGREAMLECDTWTGHVTPLPGMLIPRKKFAAAGVAGKIYVAGGSARTATVEEFDPETNKWLKVADAPRRRFGCTGASVDGVFYVIGGLKISSSVENKPSSLAAEAEAHMYASSMDLYVVATRVWLRSRAVPGGGCVVAACSAVGHVYVLTSHAVELSFWKFNAERQCDNGCISAFGEWCRMKTPPLPTQVRLDSTVRFSCVGVEDKVVLIQVTGSIDDLLRRSGRSTRGLEEKLVLLYDCRTGEWSRGADLPEVIRRAACVCVEC